MTDQHSVWKFRTAISQALPFRVEAVWDGKWWAISFPELPGCHSQTAFMEDISEQARDVLALWFNLPKESFLLNLTAKWQNPPKMGEKQ